MLCVRDIMTRRVHVLKMDMDLEEAALQLSAKQLSGAPVVDRTGHVVGVLSKTDLVHRQPGAHDVKVEDAMTPLFCFVRPDDPAIRAVRMMLGEGVHRVIVLGEHGRLSGIVTTMDLLRAIDRGEFIPVDASPNREVELHADPALAVAEAFKNDSGPCRASATR